VTLAAARDRLRSAGLRITRPRLAIIKALLAQPTPASVEQIHEAIDPGCCDRVTVYRGIAAFEEIRLVRRACLADGANRYAIDPGGEPARYHVVCRATQRIDEIDPDASGELARALRRVEDRLRARGYVDVGHRVEFVGTAPTALSDVRAQSGSADPAKPA
jgi:Fur family ferric uptake transcriptional regulator